MKNDNKSYGAERQTFSIGGSVDPFQRSASNPSSWLTMEIKTICNPSGDERIIRMAIRKYINGIVDNTFISLLNPGVELPKKIKKTTGIEAKELVTAPAFSEIAWNLVAFIGDYPFTSFCAGSDVKLLNAEFLREGIKRNLQFIDLEKFAREAFPGMKNYTLDALTRKLHLVDRGQKRQELSTLNAMACLYAMCAARASIQPHSLEDTSNTAVAEMRNDASGVLGSRAERMEELGRQKEADGSIDQAIYCYQQAIAEGIEILRPYQRLAELHHKRKEYAQEIQTCTDAIRMLERQLPFSERSIAEFRRRIESVRGK